MNEKLTEKKKIINCLYSHFKDNAQKLKIVCDWDEVIQPHEPYALWKAIDNPTDKDFSQFFKDCWDEKIIEYSPYGSRLIPSNLFTKEQLEIKNSPEFYQKAPFLTIAKELLKLVRENKVKQIIFLSAYDKRKFPNGDPRKKQIFKETFGKFSFCSLELIGFDSEGKGANKADWIKENASDFDIVIDDNPSICKNIAESIPNVIVCAPHYPAIENQHQEKVLMIKTSVSDLKKEDFKIDNYWRGRCHACGLKKTSEQLTMNNGSVCQTCVDEDLANYEKDKKEGRINDAVIFCQDCQSQYRQKREEGKIGVNPHKLTNQHDRAMELHEGEPYIIHAMILTEWECKCPNKRPIITTGIDYSNWAEGFIDEKNEGEWQCCPPDKREN